MRTQQELKDIAETLLAIGKKNPYKVPEGYFNELGNTLNEQLNLKAEDHTLPEDYFDKLPDLVIHRLKGEAKVRNINPFASMAKYIGIAASLVILIVVGNTFLPSGENEGSTIEMEYIDYLSENINEVEAISLWDLDILDEEFTTEYLNVYDDSLLDYYLERNLDDIELAYLEEIIEY